MYFKTKLFKNLLENTPFNFLSLWENNFCIYSVHLHEESRTAHPDTSERRHLNTLTWIALRFWRKYCKVAHLIDEKLVWIRHKCKFKTRNRFNLYSSERTFHSSPLNVRFRLESVLCKDGSFLQFRTLAFDFHSPVFCIIANCSFKFVATGTLILEPFEKKLCFLCYSLVKFKCWL